MPVRPAWRWQKKRGRLPSNWPKRSSPPCPPRPEIARVEALRGYLNFHVDVPAYASRLVRRGAGEAGAWGQGRPKTGQVMVEFAQPNTHKAVHVGHLRNIVARRGGDAHHARRRVGT